jgi:hypothetical protein
VAANGRVDLAGDDTSVAGEGGLANREVLTGLPGVRLDLPTGDRVRWHFVGGGPNKAEVSGFEQDRDADRNAARKGDRTRLGTLAIGNIPPPTPPSSGLIITWLAEPSPYFPIPSIPSVATITGPVAISPDPFQLVLEGWIVSGSLEIMFRKASSEDIP